MDSSKLAFKFFLADGSHFDQEAIVRVFHSWIQKHSIEGHLLIDVADYEHVENGPGTVLVAHEGNYSTDVSAGNTPGLLYVRKQPLAGDLAARIAQALKITLQAAAKLEQTPEASSPRFRTDNPIFRIYDRLAGPNEPATFDAVRAALESTLTTAYGSAVKLEYTGAGEGVFEVRITAPVTNAAALLAKL